MLISLDGDDRSGHVTAGENLSVDLSQTARIKRILVFALIYEGAANWADAKGVATLYPVNAAAGRDPLDEPRDGARICAIAMLENQQRRDRRAPRGQLHRRRAARARRGLRLGHELDAGAQVRGHAWLE